MAVAELPNIKQICYSFVMKNTKYTLISWLLAHTIFLLFYLIANKKLLSMRSIERLNGLKLRLQLCFKTLSFDLINIFNRR